MEREVWDQDCFFFQMSLDVNYYNYLDEHPSEGEQRFNVIKGFFEDKFINRNKVID